MNGTPNHREGKPGKRGRALIGYLILTAGVVFAFWLTYQQGQNLEREIQRNMARGEQIEAIGAQNRATTCSIARLVSYVPALQFEGEPQSNFVNWILARKALLSEVQETFGCSDAVEAVLAERVRLDQRVLDELEKP